MRVLLGSNMLEVSKSMTLGNNTAGADDGRHSRTAPLQDKTRTVEKD